jgi:uncharacterized protein YxjI
MRYFVREKLLFFDDEFRILDDTGTEAFVVSPNGEGEWRFLDSDGLEHARIREVSGVFRKTYEIFRGSQKCAAMHRDWFSIFHWRFTVELPDHAEYTASGNFPDHEYEIHRAGAVVARVSRRWFAMHDAYGVHFAPGADTVLLLSAAVMIDHFLHLEACPPKPHAIDPPFVHVIPGIMGAAVGEGNGTLVRP